MEVRVRRALISVSRKDEAVVDFVRVLKALDIEVWASKGTAEFLSGYGLVVESLDRITGFGARAGGRVKTLHPEVFARILEVRGGDSVGERFDLVAVDLYPFEEEVHEGTDEAEAVELIDVGGVALLRAAAKNYFWVVPVPGREYFGWVGRLLAGRNGVVSLGERRRLAVETFSRVSAYDARIFQYLLGRMHVQDGDSDGDEKDVPRWWAIGGGQCQPFVYGENPHQRGWLYGDLSAMGIRQVSGKALSWNNVLDVVGGLRLLFRIRQARFEGHVGMVIKHGQPCGVAVGESPREALMRAWASDPESAFGGVLVVTGEVGGEVGEWLRSRFFEVLAAESVSETFLEVLGSQVERRRILTYQLDRWSQVVYQGLWLHPGGLLIQEMDRHVVLREGWKWQTEVPGDARVLADLELAWLVVAGLYSNAVVLVRGQQVIGIGCGQPSRVRAVLHALEHARRFHGGAKGAVLASDGFFPFPDSVELAGEAGVVAIVQPGGSRRDSEVVDAARRLGVGLAFVGVRHFRHF